MADNRFGVKLDKGYSQSWEMNLIAPSGTSASIAVGAPTKSDDVDASVNGSVIVMVDGDGTTSQRFAGICKRTSDETASAAGTVGVWAPVPGIVYRANAKTATTADTQSEINALMMKRVVFDLSSSNWTVDAAAADALANCVVICGGSYQTSEILFVYSPKGTIFDTSTAIT